MEQAVSIFGSQQWVYRGSRNPDPTVRGFCAAIHSWGETTSDLKIPTLCALRNSSAAPSHSVRSCVFQFSKCEFLAHLIACHRGFLRGGIALVLLQASCQAFTADKDALSAPSIAIHPATTGSLTGSTLASKIIHACSKMCAPGFATKNDRLTFHQHRDRQTEIACLAWPGGGLGSFPSTTRTRFYWQPA